MSDFEDCGTALNSFEWRPECKGRTENVLAATYTNGKIIHWLASTGKRLTTIDCESEAIDIAYHQNGSKFVVGCEDGRIYEYDDVKKCDPNIYGLIESHANRVQAVKCFDDKVISAGWDNNLKVWDTRSLKIVQNFHTSCPYKDALDIHDNYILVGSFDFQNHIKIFDVRNLKDPVLEKTVKTQNCLRKEYVRGDAKCKIHAARFCNFDKKKIAVSTCYNNSIKILQFDGDYMEQLCSYEALKGKVMSLDSVPNEKSIYFTGEQVYGELKVKY